MLVLLIVNYHKNYNRKRKIKRYGKPTPFKNYKIYQNLPERDGGGKKIQSSFTLLSSLYPFLLMHNFFTLLGVTDQMEEVLYSNLTPTSPILQKCPQGAHIPPELYPSSFTASLN